LGNDRNGTDYTVLDSAAPFAGGIESPRGVAGRNLPVFALVAQEFIGPCLFDDLEAFLEGGAIGRVDLVMLMRQRAVDAVSLLCHHIDPSALISAGETGIGAAARHVIEHRDILGDANRILGGQDDTELSDAQPLRL